MMKAKTLALIALIATATVPFLALTHTAHAAGTRIEREPVYANGQTFTMLVNPSAVDGSRGATAKVAEPLYLIAFQVAPSFTGPLTLPGGYQPQCNPCFHPGVPPMLAYHDHVLEGAPGFGTSGTAHDFNPIWHAFVLVYNPAFAIDPNFTPIKSDESIDAGIAAGHFVDLSTLGLPVPPNTYEFDTGITFLCITLPN